MGRKRHRQNATKELAMTTQQYLAAIKRLGLSTASKRTAAALGLSVRHLQRIAAGQTELPSTAERLLAMYLVAGLPDYPKPSSPAEDHLTWSQLYRAALSAHAGRVPLIPLEE